MKRGQQSPAQTRERFLRATHDDGDHAVFSLKRERHEVGQSEASAICLPGPDVYMHHGHVVRTEDRLRYRAPVGHELEDSAPEKEHNRRAPLNARIGAFTLTEVENGELEDGRHLLSQWKCRFRPRPLERVAGMALVARQENHARGSSLVVDVDHESPSLHEALTWLPEDRVVGMTRSALDPARELLPLVMRSKSSDSGAHLLRVHHVVETDKLCLAMMPFFASLSFLSLVRMIQAGSVDTTIVVGVLRQLTALMDERGAADVRAFPLDWRRLRLGFDGRLRLPMAGPWDWQEEATKPDSTAMTTSVSAMFAEDAPRQSPLRSLTRRMQESGWQNISEPGASVEDVGRWLSAIAPITRERQDNFQTLAQMIA